LDDDRNENNPVPKINQDPLSTVMGPSEHDTVFANVLRRLAEQDSEAYAAHGSSPAVPDEA
jgi:hypothetical protein